MRTLHRYVSLNLCSAYYEELAYMRDSDRVQRLLGQLRQIGDLRFQYNFTGVVMLSWADTTLQMGGILPSEEVGEEVLGCE